MPTSLYLTSAFYVTLLIDMSCTEYVEEDKRAMHGQLYGWCIDEPIQAQERHVVNLLVSDLLTIANSAISMVAMTDDCGKRSAVTLACLTVASCRHSRTFFGQISRF